MIMLGKSGVVDVRINLRSVGPSTFFFGREGKKDVVLFFPFPRKKARSRVRCEFVKEEREEDFIAVYNEIPRLVLRNDRPSRFVIKKAGKLFLNM